MEIFEVCEAFSSLSQETRLKVFKLLIEYGRSGVSAGRIAQEIDIPNNTLSFHLAHMTKAGLVRSEKEGRSITYFANTETITALIDFLQENCCARETSAKGKEMKCKERKKL